MKIAVAKEIDPSEPRVAASPDTVKKFRALGAEVAVEPGAGVKSGLPLNECLSIIARESPSPIREEFAELVEQQRVGVPMSECFERMISRLPLPEVKFFGIVVSIQQQAGGNLSEALGNLSGVLREAWEMDAWHLVAR